MHRTPWWFHIFLAIHITVGVLSFVLAPVALATAKGGRQHRRWGKVYFWSMAVVAGTALPMALFRPVLFLVLVSVLSFYLTFSGVRILRLKHLACGGSAQPVDWIAAILTFATCACLAALGWLRPVAVQGMGIVAIVLGVIGMRSTAADMYKFVHKPVDKMHCGTAISRSSSAAISPPGPPSPPLP